MGGGPSPSGPIPLGTPLASPAVAQPSAMSRLPVLIPKIRDFAVIVACVVVVIGLIAYAIGSISEGMTARKNASKPGPITISMTTDSDNARLTFTNTGAGAQFECAKAVVTNKKNPAMKATSVGVCSGDLPAHSSTTVEAAYPRDAVRSVCGGLPDRTGVRYVEWDRCTYDVAPADSAAPAVTALPPQASLDAGVPALPPNQPLRPAEHSAINAAILARVKADDPAKTGKVEVNDGYSGKSVKAEIINATTDKTIVAIEGYVYGFDGFDEPASLASSDFYRLVYQDGFSIDPGKSDTGSWRTYSDIATAASMEIIKVKFKDGSTWQRPKE
jgi:hypothetical protein